MCIRDRPGGDRTLRIFGFLDAGYAWGYEGFVNANGHADYRRQEFSMSDLRYSTGIGVAWISPLGPLKFSLAFPLNEKEGDEPRGRPVVGPCAAVKYENACRRGCPNRAPRFFQAQR